MRKEEMTVGWVDRVMWRACKGEAGRNRQKNWDSPSYRKREDCSTKSKFKLYKQSTDLMSTREPGRLAATADGKKYNPLESGGGSDMLSCHNALACVSVNLILA